MVSPGVVSGLGVDTARIWVQTAGPASPVKLTKIEQAQDRQKVYQNHVYVIPPGKYLATVNGHFKLTELENDRGERRPWSSFFDRLPTYWRSVIFMDTGMSEMEGDGVARRIRAQPEYNAITLVTLSGWGQDADCQRCKNAGFDHHLVKPVELEVVKRLLGTIAQTIASPDRKIGSQDA